jgi:hypothetical protein
MNGQSASADVDGKTPSAGGAANSPTKIHVDGKHFMNGFQYDVGRDSYEILSSYKCPKRSVKEARLFPRRYLYSLVLL